jgi:hypothetical protein
MLIPSKLIKLGTLMELDDGDTKDALRMLVAKEKSGQLGISFAQWDKHWKCVSEDGWKLVVPQDGDEPVMALVSESHNRERKCPRHQYPLGMHSLSLDNEEEPRNKSKIAVESFCPEQENWECGKCGNWNHKYWGHCYNEAYNGTYAEDAVSVQSGRG